MFHVKPLALLTHQTCVSHETPHPAFQHLQQPAMFHVKHGGVMRRIPSINGMVSRETPTLTTTSRGRQHTPKPSQTTHSINPPHQLGFHVKHPQNAQPRSLFSQCENSSTSTGGKAERTCHPPWASLLPETNQT